MKRFLALLAAVALLLFTAGCHREDILSIGYDLPSVPRSLDPQIASDAAAHLVIRNIFEGLFSLDETGALQNAAAESYDVSPDRLTYTFQIRRDARWTYRDEAGNEVYTPVTADDFVFGLQRLLLPGTNSPAAQRFFCIQNAEAVYRGEMEADELGVRATGEYLLQIELSAPNENFLNLLASTYAMPCNREFFEGTMGRYGLEKDTIPANGCFKVYSWDKKSEIRLSRNGGYRNAEEVLPDVVRLYLDETAEDSPRDSLARLLEGRVDAALVDGGLEELSGRGFNSEPVENAVWGLYLNWDNPALANPHIREAMALALNRDAYAGLLSDNLRPAGAILPQGVFLDGRSFRELAGDDLAPAYHPEQGYGLFKEGLNELGGSVGELRLLINRDAPVDAAEYFQAVSQVFQRELSLFIAIDEVSGSEFDARLAAGDFDIAFYRIQSVDNTPWSILSGFLSDSPANYSGYQNTEFDAALNAAGMEPGESARWAYYFRAEEILLEDSAFLPLFYATDYFVTQPGITGVAYNPQTGLVDFRSAGRN